MNNLEIIKQLHSLNVRKLLTWEKDFIADIWNQTGEGTDDAFLDNGRIDTIRRIYEKYIGDEK